MHAESPNLANLANTKPKQKAAVVGEGQFLNQYKMIETARLSSETG